MPIKTFSKDKKNAKISVCKVGGRSSGPRSVLWNGQNIKYWKLQ